LNPTLIPVIAISIVAALILFFIIKSTITPRRTEEIARLTKEGNYTAAIKLGKSLVQKDNSNALAHYYLGKAYIADKKYDIAMQVFDYLNKNAEFAVGFSEIDFRHDIAKLYEHYEQHEEALKEYLMLTKQEPNNDDNFYQAGRLFEKREKIEQAFKYYKLAIQINDKNADAHSALGVIFFKTKQFVEAKKEIEYAIKLNPRAYQYYYHLGKILKTERAFSEAINAFEKSLRDPVYKQRSFLERGLCYIEVKSYEKATIELERAVSVSQANDSIETIYSRYYLAFCYEKMRNLDNAIKQWELISKVKRNFKDVNNKLAEYQDIQTNDLMKDYLTSSVTEFSFLCQTLTASVFKLTATDTQSERGGVSITAVPQTEKTNKDEWKNNRVQQTLLYFFRENTPIDENFLRRTLENMKKRNISNCIICTTAGFTSPALKFADGRPFELIDKQKLDTLLANAG
jgi:tetratricopeptide (TPR) repeat protein